MAGPPFNFADDAERCELVNAETSGSTTIEIQRQSDGANPVNWPATDGILAIVDRKNDKVEVVTWDSYSSGVITVGQGTRGAFGTTAQSWSAADTVIHTAGSRLFELIQENERDINVLVPRSLNTLTTAHQSWVQTTGQALPADSAAFDFFKDESKIFSSTNVTITDVDNDADPVGKVELSGSNTSGHTLSEVKDFYGDANFIYIPEEAYATVDADIPADEGVNLTLEDGYGNSVALNIDGWTDLSALNSGLCRVKNELTSSDGNDTPTERSYQIHVREGVGDYDDIFYDYFADESKIASKTDVAVTTEGGGTHGKVELEVGVIGYSLSSASYDSVSFGVGTEDTTPFGIAFKSDGTKMFMVGNDNDTVYQYSLSTAWDLSSASYDSVSFDVSTEDTGPLDIAFKSDGTKMFMVGNDNDTVYQYSTSEESGYVSTGSFDSTEHAVGFTPTSVQIEAARTIPADEDITFDLTDENANTENITSAQLGTEVSTPSFTGTNITVTANLSSSDGNDTPTLNEYEIRFYA